MWVEFVVVGSSSYLIIYLFIYLFVFISDLTGLFAYAVIKVKLMLTRH